MDFLRYPLENPWRCFVVILFVTTISLGVKYYLDNQIDTEEMLDVSVSIRTVSGVTIDQVGDSVWESSSGSGFLVSSKECTVWTNYHVVENSVIIEVFPRGQRSSDGISATVLRFNPRSDFAVLKMDNCDGVREARLGDSKELASGDEVFGVGNPLGTNPDSIARGIISHTERYLYGNPNLYLQSDVSVNRGNSGGALFDKDGKVVGINTAIASIEPRGGSIGISYSLPINLAIKIDKDLLSGPAMWGDAGLEGIVSALASDESVFFGLESNHFAIAVTDTPIEGPSADILFEDDVIYEINGYHFNDLGHALRMIGNLKPKSTVLLSVIRNGKPIEIDIELGNGYKEPEKVVQDYYEGFLGMTLEMWSDRHEEELRKFKSPVIVRVQNLGPAHRALISSSQKAIGASGPFLVPYQLDVKMIVGVVINEIVHEISTIEEIEEIARDAYKERKPILLKLDYWHRTIPRNLNSPMAKIGTAYFKILPEPSTVIKEGI